MTVMLHTNLRGDDASSSRCRRSSSLLALRIAIQGTINITQARKNNEYKPGICMRHFASSNCFFEIVLSDIFLSACPCVLR